MKYKIGVAINPDRLQTKQGIDFISWVLTFLMLATGYIALIIILA